MGDPEFKIRDIIKREKIAVFSSNYALYGQMSDRVVQTLGSMVRPWRFTPLTKAF